MKKILFFLVLLFVGSSTFAQNHKRDIIYMKDGSIVKGRYVPVDNDRIAVRSGRNIWIFKNSLVDSISSKQPFEPSAPPAGPYFLETTFGVLAGSSNNEKQSPFSFDASFNYGFFPKFYTGVGLGVDLLENSYMPVFLNLEYHFRKSGFTPFVGVKGGYMIALDKEMSTTIYYDYYSYSTYYWPTTNQDKLKDKGGMMVNPSFGFVSQINENLGISLAFGYRYHETTFKGDNHYQLDKSYNRLTIRLGILFK